MELYCRSENYAPRFLYATEAHSGGDAFIREPSANTEITKAIKIQIPIKYHIKLHSLKLVTGKNIGDVVTEALEMYFAAVGNDQLSKKEDLE